MLFYNKRNKNKQANEQKCNHNFSDDNNTLQVIPKLKMVYPMKMDFFCVKCNKTFTLTQEELKKYNIDA